MIKSLINNFNSKVNFPDLGILILRVAFSAMLLLHGIHKLIHGTGFIQEMLIDLNLPVFIAYGVFIGEIIAPILIILGLYTRIASIFMIGTCVTVIGLVHMGDFFTVDSHGAWSVESIGTYLFASIAILLIGSGKYALRPD